MGVQMNMRGDVPALASPFGSGLRGRPGVAANLGRRDRPEGPMRLWLKLHALGGRQNKGLRCLGFRTRGIRGTDQ